MRADLDALHERFDRDEDELPSERSLGLLFASVCILVGAIKIWKGSAFSLLWLGAAAILLSITLIRPILLRPLNRLWMKLAELLYRIVNPVVLALLYFVAFVPIGLFLRFSRMDVLRLKLDRAAQTYWIERVPPGPKPDSMINQF